MNVHEMVHLLPKSFVIDFEWQVSKPRTVSYKDEEYDVLKYQGSMMTLASDEGEFEVEEGDPDVYIEFSDAENFYYVSDKIFAEKLVKHWNVLPNFIDVLVNPLNGEVYIAIDVYGDTSSYLAEILDKIQAVITDAQNI